MSAPVIPIGARGGPIVGIDLGTTNSLVSVLQGGRPVVLPNGLGQGLTPSAVSIDDRGEVLVGAPALARLAAAPERTATAFKRDMGTERKYTLGPQTFSAPELSALVLKSLRADAEAARTEATAIVDEARRDADEVKRRIEEDGRAESAAMIERARREIGIAKETAVKELYILAAQLTTQAASKVLRREIQPSDHERLIRDAMQELSDLKRN